MQERFFVMHKVVINPIKTFVKKDYIELRNVSEFEISEYYSWIKEQEDLSLKHILSYNDWNICNIFLLLVLKYRNLLFIYNTEQKNKTNINKQDIERYLVNSGYEIEIRKDSIIARKLLGKYEIFFESVQKFCHEKSFLKKIKNNHNLLLVTQSEEDKIICQKFIMKNIKKHFETIENFFEDGYVYSVVTIDEILQLKDYPRKLPPITKNLE